jgi:PEGA domain
MEYLIVRFPDSRTVYVDGEECGFTNRKFRVEAGTHTVSLGDPRNYTPNWRRPTVTATTALHPMEVTFDREGGE